MRGLFAFAAFSDALDPIYSSLDYPELCGVIGGVGPEASAVFFLQLVKRQAALFDALKASVVAGATSAEQLVAVQAVSTAPWTVDEVSQLATFPTSIADTSMGDQHHIPVLLYDNPQIPDRTKFILESNRSAADRQALDPGPFFRKTAMRLGAAGATCVAVVCNTAHHFLPELAAAVPGATVLNMLELTLRSVAPKAQKVGLLATSGTVSTGIYQGVAAGLAPAIDVSIVTPDEVAGGNQSAVMDAIYGEYGIKAGFTDLSTPKGAANRALLLAEAQKLIDAGCGVVVLGCTEIPLVLHVEKEILPLSNPVAALSDEITRLTLRSRRLEVSTTDTHPPPAPNFI